MRQIVRDRIFARDGRKCRRCPSTENLEIDHIIPLSKGGRHDEDNFQVLCRTCNRKKSNKFDLSPYFKIGVNPDYILVNTAIIDLLPDIGITEYASVHVQKLKENDRIFAEV